MAIQLADTTHRSIGSKSTADERYLRCSMIGSLLLHYVPNLRNVPEPVINNWHPQ